MRYAFSLLGSAITMVPGWIGESIEEIKDIKYNKYNGIQSIVTLFTLLFSLVAGIVGIIIYHVNGGYQGPGMFENAKTYGLFDAFGKTFDTESVSYMYHSWVFVAVIVLIVAQVIMCFVKAIMDSESRTCTIVGFASLGVFVGALTFIGLTNILSAISPIGIVLAVVALASIVVSIIFLIKGLRRSETGWMMGLTIFAAVFHTAIMPFIMIITQDFKNTLQAFGLLIFAAIVMIIGFFMVLGMLTGGSSEGSYNEAPRESASDIRKAAEMKKAVERREYLMNKRDSYNEALYKRNRGDMGYGYIDPKTQRNAIRDMEEEINMLNRKIG